jgi:hypothetical protein
VLDGHYKEYWANERFGERQDRLRLRVNDPEIVLHPDFGSRWETRANGQTTIVVPEDPGLLTAAEVLLELWGGHPGSISKAVSLNGYAPHAIADPGTEAGDCVYQYPSIPVDLHEIRKGRNSLQFSIGRGTSFWGHCIVDNAAIAVGLGAGHPDIESIDIHARTPRVIASMIPLEEVAVLRIDLDEVCSSPIERVDYLARYTGYDNSGSGSARSWHAYTMNQRIAGHIGSSDTWPFTVRWDLSLLPDQTESIEIAAIINYANGVRYRTRVEILSAAPVAGRSIRLHSPTALPRPFWSRDGIPAVCFIELDVDPAVIKKVQVRARIWDGGAGDMVEHFTINGFSYPIATGLAHHDLVQVKREVDPRHLKRGMNELRLVSNTAHHGLEMLLPGPAFIIRE